MTRIPNSPGVYCILNLKDGRHYVGSSQNLRVRKIGHWCELRGGYHGNAKLQRSWTKHSEENFRFDVLELTTLEQIVEREQYFLDQTLPYYNILRVAHSGKGYKHTKEEIAASSVRGKAWWASMSQDERDALIAKAAASRRGVKFSEESKIRMGEAHRGIVKTAEWRENLSVSHRKNYVATNPQGEEISVFGLNKFCEEHGLSQGSLSQVIAGKRTHHKGWKCRRVWFF